MKHRILAYCIILGCMAGCLSSPMLNQYRGKELKLYAQTSEDRIVGLVEVAEKFLEEAGAYLSLDVPDQGALSIYLYRWRWDLWRHLGRLCPRWRWRRAACCEDTSGFTIGMFGRPESTRVLLDLRHELVHYLLASNFVDFPPWIDEGLAQVMAESPPFLSPSTSDKKRIQHILKNACLEDFKDLVSVLPGERLTRAQARLAWAWTYALLEEFPDGRDRIINYLTETRSDSDQTALFSKIWGRSLEEMVVFVEELGLGKDVALGQP